MPIWSRFDGILSVKKRAWVYNPNFSKIQGIAPPPNDEGVYMIRCATNDKHKPMPIDRVNGTDEGGILYYGSSDKLSDRILSFWKAANENKKNIKEHHSGGNTYALFDYVKKFPLANLEVSWEIYVEQWENLNFPGKNGIEKRESQLLHNYCNKFLDRPPLNLNIKRWQRNTAE